MVPVRIVLREHLPCGQHVWFCGKQGPTALGLQLFKGSADTAGTKSCHGMELRQRKRRGWYPRQLPEPGTHRYANGSLEL